MCDKSIKLFAAITILLGLATLCPCTSGLCQNVQTEESSAIAEIIYHPGSEKMVVIFRDQTEYSFEDVPSKTFEAFKNSESKGKFFSENIRDEFKSSQQSH